MDAVDNSSVSNIVCSNKPEHECARTPPLEARTQVPPAVAPPPDKPEEPPPARPTDKAASPPTLKSRAMPRLTHHHDIAHIARAPTTPRSDDFGDDRKRQRQVDPGGSNFKLPPLQMVQIQVTDLKCVNSLFSL